MKPLLCLLTCCVCLCLPGRAAALAPQEPIPAQQPQETAQPPAPIVRPKPSILKPKPVPSSVPSPVGATGSTGAGGQTVPSRPRPATAASGATGSTGSTVHVSRPKPPAIGASGSTGTVTPHPAPTPAIPARIQPAGTAAISFNRTTIVLDPSHGGIDGGSRIADTLQEKDVDLAFAFKLRSLLTARGFTVLLTRETEAATPPDSGTPLTLDDRAGIANHLHPVACLLLHSTGSGKGVHLYSSELAPQPLQPPVVPWLTAQAPWVSASRALQRELGTAITRAEVPLVMSRASIRPLDSMACPALVLELAPDGSDKDSVNDGSYQQRVANAIASAMVFWQSRAQPPDRQLPAPPPGASSSPSAMSSTGVNQP